MLIHTSSPRRRRPSVHLVIPLVLVNIVAIMGQYGWAVETLAAGVAVAVLFASAVESVSIYLAIEAHKALMAGDASLRLRLASYTAALTVGGLNYSHRSGPDLAPNAAAIAFGLLSAISPILWEIRSKSMHSEQLRTKGLVEPRAVRFSTLRWLLFPGRTFRAFRAAVWTGETDPTRAIALHDLEMSARVDVVRVPRVDRASWLDRLLRRRRALAPTPPRDVTAPVTLASTPQETPQIEAPPAPAKTQRPAPTRHATGPAARRAILDNHQAQGAIPSVRDLARMHGGSTTVWGDTVKAYRARVDA